MFQCCYFCCAEEYDDYDAEFDKMREATLKTRQVQAKEEYAEAQKRVEECRQQLEHAKSQVQRDYHETKCLALSGSLLFKRILCLWITKAVVHRKLSRLLKSVLTTSQN